MSEKDNKKNILISSVLLVMSVAMLSWLGTNLYKINKLDKLTREEIISATSIPEYEATKEPDSKPVVVETPTPKPESTAEPEEDVIITFD